MKKYSTLPDVVEVKNIDLTTLRVLAEKDNFGNTVAVVTNPACLMAVGNDEVYEGKTRLTLRYVVAKFISADSRISSYFERAFAKDLAVAEEEGVIGKIVEDSSEEDIKTVLALKSDLRNRLLINLLRAGATINITYHKNDKTDAITGEIKEGLKIGIDDISINLKDGFIAALDKSVAKATTFNFD